MTDLAYRLQLTRWRGERLGLPIPWVASGSRQDYGPDDLPEAAADYAHWRNNPNPDRLAEHERSMNWLDTHKPQPTVGAPTPEPLPAVSVRVDDQGRHLADVDGHDSWLLELIPTPTRGAPT